MISDYFTRWCQLYVSINSPHSALDPTQLEDVDSRVHASPAVAVADLEAKLNNSEGVAHAHCNDFFPWEGLPVLQNNTCAVDCFADESNLAICINRLSFYFANLGLTL